jgi:hypothetical protein
MGVSFLDILLRFLSASKPVTLPGSIEHDLYRPL